MVGLLARLRRARRAQLRAARHARRVGDPAARRDDPLDLELRPVPRTTDGVERVTAAVAEDGFDAVVAIGGEHTMAITRRLCEEHGLPLIGVPKTIDNDVPCTDFTFGFDTAVQVATDAIDRLHTTAQSHDRVMVIEVMGRNTGWIAVFSGIAGGADAIVIPELELTVEEICDAINARHERGKDFSIVVVAEGAELAFASGEKRQVRASQRDRPVRLSAARRHRPGARQARSRRAPASRRASRRSATCSAAARRRRPTACSPPATA